MSILRCLLSWDDPVGVGVGMCPLSSMCFSTSRDEELLSLAEGSESGVSESGKHGPRVGVACFLYCLYSRDGPQLHSNSAIETINKVHGMGGAAIFRTGLHLKSNNLGNGPEILCWHYATRTDLEKPQTMALFLHPPRWNRVWTAATTWCMMRRFSSMGQGAQYAHFPG